MSRRTLLPRIVARESILFVLLIAVEVVFLAIGYGAALKLPFLNDDYLFLDKVRDLDFIELWRPEQLIFYWYRPWSRELHYWVIERLFGPKEAVFHVISMGLWAVLMLTYFNFVRRLSGATGAAIATAGASLLALWSAPLLWIAGAQDLWMLCFGLLSITAAVRGSWAVAALSLLLALLSKETAAVIPGIVLAYLLIVTRAQWTKALRQTAPLWGVVAVWAILHPTLGQRFFGPLQHSVETEARPGPGITLLKTFLVQLNLENAFAPDGGWTAVILRGLMVGSLFAAFVYFVSQRGDSPDSLPEPSRPLIVFGSVWCLLGWAPLFMPSIGWHAYYGVLGSLGFWLVLGVVLRRQVRVACTALLALALLRDASIATPSWDWGSHWYQKRAGSFLEAIHERIKGLYPTLPHYSRLYFARVPNNIGLLAGDGPAIRIWYNDPTLQARFYSAYTARRPNEPPGRDLFFRFDSLQVLTEVLPGRSEPQGRIASYSEWARDHAVLASVLIRGGNLQTAAEEYEKLWRASANRPDYALYAATAYDAAGIDSSALSLYAAARSAFGDSLVDAQAQALLDSARVFQLRALGRTPRP